MNAKSLIGAGLAIWIWMGCFGAGAAQPAARALFNGKDLSGWKVPAGKGSEGWIVGRAGLDPANPTKLAVLGEGNELVICEKAPNIVSEETFGDCVLELEFMMAKNSNSGVKMMTIYEIQLLDSYGKEKLGDGDCGAVYKESPPRVNATRPPGEWQKLMIDFRAPRFDAEGKKTASARFVKVTLNGQVIQEDVEIAHGTNVSRNAKEFPTGAILIQGDHGPVAFRNIRIARVGRE
jgi:hypothetical protein